MSTERSTNNHATQGSRVGIQASVVHEANVYLSQGDDPQDIFADGLRYLDLGMASEARKRIGEALSRGYRGSRADYYRVLASLSGRSLAQLKPEEVEQVRHVLARHRFVVSDEWTRGLAFIDEMIHARDDEQQERPSFRQRLRAQPAQRCAELERHLALLMDGSARDASWDGIVAQMEVDKLARCRRDRAWRFFEQPPARPRVRWPAKPMIPVRSYLLAGVAAAAVLGTMPTLVWLASGASLGWGLAASVLLAAGLWVLGSGAVAWRASQPRRTVVVDRQPFQGRRPPAPGFAADIDELFDRYLRKYRPEGVKPTIWLARTAIARKQFRDELVEVFRERRIGATRLSWLVRYLVRDIVQQWNDNAFSIPTRPVLSGGLRMLAGGASVAVGAVTLIVQAFPGAPLSTTANLVVGGPGLGILFGLVVRVVADIRRFRCDMRDARRRLVLRTKEYERWCRVLAARPNDAEMARWLACDRTLLIDEFMRFHQLRPSSTVAYAVIEAPDTTERTISAREEGGPWRYSHYRLVIVLLTLDGVRQTSVKLDFRRGYPGGRERVNYRFDAVASVRVEATAYSDKRFKLTLINGEAIDIHQLVGHVHPQRRPDTSPKVKAAPVAEVDEEEQEDESLDITLDAAGFARALYLLEGIAAEGKSWIEHERRREHEQAAALLGVATKTTRMPHSVPRPTRRRPAGMPRTPGHRT